MPEARKRFLAYLSEDHRYLQMRGFGADLRVPLELEPIYIALRAVPSHAEMARCGPDDDTETPRIEELEIGPALDFAHQHGYSGLIVLGEPGSGKTTLLKFITLCLAQQTPAAKSGIAPNRFPLYLPLRAVADFKVSLEDALRTVYHEIQSNLPGDFFARVLADEQTRCLIMLDGLDEVATAERRTEALEWIERQRKLYPGQQLLVTSRFAGYRGATRLPENYLELHIREFRDEDVRTFVRRWYRQVETRQRGDTDQWRGWARGQSDDLIQQLFSAENLLGLARNPLLLQLLCLLHRTHGAMPKRRAELYEECIKVLLQKWDEAKGLEVFLTATEARQVLRPLALWLHEEEGRTYADEDDVRRVIRPHLARVKRETQAQAEEQLDRVLTSVRDRSGLFVGFDVARYGFQHLSFQEFLAAEEIVKLGESGRLVEPFGRPWWREPTLLAVGMDDPRFQTALFEQLVPSPQCGQHLDLALACVREALGAVRRAVRRHAARPVGALAGTAPLYAVPARDRRSGSDRGARSRAGRSRAAGGRRGARRVDSIGPSAARRGHGRRSRHPRQRQGRHAVDPHPGRRILDGQRRRPGERTAAAPGASGRVLHRSASGDQCAVCPVHEGDGA
jgi:hypothetical protein